MDAVSAEIQQPMPLPILNKLYTKSHYWINGSNKMTLTKSSAISLVKNDQNSHPALNQYLNLTGYWLGYNWGFSVKIFFASPVPVLSIVDWSNYSVKTLHHLLRLIGLRFHVQTFTV